MNSGINSGFFYPNKLSKGIFDAIIDVAGKNGLNAILNLAHLRQYIDNYPLDDMEKKFDFAEFSAIQTALEEMYGEHGGRAFIKRAGRMAFTKALGNYGALVGVRDAAFRNLPLQTQLKIGVQVLARIFTQISDQQTTVEEDETQYRYIVHNCPECWGRSGMGEAICSFGTGLLEEGLKIITAGYEFKVVETKCTAKGDGVCEYSIGKEPIR